MEGRAEKMMEEMKGQLQKENTFITCPCTKQDGGIDNSSVSRTVLRYFPCVKTEVYRHITSEPPKTAVFTLVCLIILLHEEYFSRL